MSDPAHLVLRVSREHLALGDPEGRPVAAFTSRRMAIVVGDLVEVRRRAGRLEAVGVLPRRTTLRRHEREGERVLAANVDQLLIVTAVAQFRAGLVDRMLVAGEVDGIEPILVLNKVDLPEAPASLEAALRYRGLGYRVFPTSALTGQGFQGLARALRGRASALAGHSGAGKSSILNRLAPGAARAVAAVNPVTSKGRHTTSVAEGYPYKGGVLIDFPGIREFGLAGVDPRRLARAMPDLRGLADECRFADCAHEVEPGCAVRAALEAGRLDPDRYDSYLRMLESVRHPEVPTREPRHSAY